MNREYAETHRIEEDYHGYQLRVDGKGKFFAFDDSGHKMGEAHSLQALKDLLRKPVKLDLKGMMAGDYYYSDTEKMETVHVYAVTGLGTLLYSKGREKKRATESDPIFVHDTQRAKERERLKKVSDQVRVDLDKLMKSWPKINGKKLLPEKKP